MVLGTIRAYLLQSGFTELSTNTKNIIPFFRRMEDSFLVILFVDFECESFTKEQYLSVKAQIEKHFYENEGVSASTIGIISGNELEDMKKCVEDCEDTWLLDNLEKRIMLFENQTEQYAWLRKDIEQLLQKDDPASVNYKLNYFNICTVVIVVINSIIFFLTDIFMKGDIPELFDDGALIWPLVTEGHQYYRLITYMFLHSGISHIANNMLILFLIGNRLERAIGKWKYVVIYFASGILAGIASIVYNMHQNVVAICVGASGAIFGVCGALAYLVVFNRGWLIDLSRRQIILFVLLSLYGGFTSQGVDNAAHVGGLIAGILLAAILCHKKKQKPIAKKE